MKHWLCIAVILMTGAAPALAADDNALPVDNRIKMLKYDPSDVYTITTRYGYQTNIVFDKDEQIQTISVGDRSLWQILPEGNRIFIRPMDEDVATNMTVLTNEHSYQFDLVSLAGDKKTGNIYVARFIYDSNLPALAPMVGHEAPPPSPPPAQQAAEKEPMYRPSTPLPSHDNAPLPVHRNYDYTFSGADELAPLQVFDDGHSTYFKCRDIQQPLPNAYIINTDGTLTLTTPYVRQDFMVIDAVAPEFALKNSNGTVYVYNEKLNPR